MAIDGKGLAHETKTTEISSLDDRQCMLLTFSLLFCPVISLSFIFFVDGQMNDCMMPPKS